MHGHSFGVETALRARQLLEGCAHSICASYAELAKNQAG
jgi:hypothetical protein